MSDGPRPRDPAIAQIQSALRKPWAEGQVLQIVDGIPTWADPPAGGGGAAPDWRPLSEIWTPAPGCSSGAGRHIPRYAVDANFLYLAGDIFVGYSGPVDNSMHPFYGLGDISHAPIPGSRPTADENMNSWLFPAATDNAVQVGLSMPWAGELGSGVLSMNVDADYPVLGATTLTLDGTMLPWQP
jgi:hypothetical protein